MSDETKPPEPTANLPAPDVPTEPAAKPPAVPPWLLPVLKTLLTWLTVAAAGGAGGYVASRSTVPPVDPPEAIVVPREVKGGTLSAIRIDAVTDGVKVRWRAVDSGLLLIDGADSKTQTVVACRPGKYRVECWSAVGNEPTSIYQVTVTVTGPDPEPIPPPPLPPVPPPGPDPPLPNPPHPPTPPVDPFQAKCQAAYDADAAAAATKRGQLSLMIGLYQEMTKHSQDATITTTGDLLSDYRKVAQSMLSPSVLIELRKLISAEVAATFGTESSALDATMRTKATALWDRLAKTLGEVK